MTQNSNPAGNPVISGLVNATLTPANAAAGITSGAPDEEYERFESLAASLVGVPKTELNR